MKLFPILLLSAACTPGRDPAQVVEGSATLTVDGGPTGSEEVDLSTLTWSEVQDDGGGTLIATDDALVHELMITVDEATEGTQVPTMVRYRKGLQVLLDHEADCTVDLSRTSVVDQPWAGTFSCTGLTAEDPEGSSEGWTLSGDFEGGTTASITVRAEAFTAPGYTFELAIEGEEDVAPVTALDPERATVLPYRGKAVWVIFEDGADDTLDDVVLKAVPESGRIELRKWVRASASEEASLSLTVTSTEELELEVGVEETGESGTGAEVVLSLWDSLQDDPSTLTVLIQ